MFSFIRGLATFTVGIIGVLLIRRSPEVKADEYALGKYKVGILFTIKMRLADNDDRVLSYTLRACPWRVD